MRIYTSSKGNLCAEKNGKNVHSKYDPVKEAKRFVINSILEKKDLIIFLGAGLGYIQKELSQQFPDSKILAIYYDQSLYENKIENFRNVSAWHPGSSKSIEQFFQLHISEQYLRDLVLIEWNPSSLIYEKLSYKINQKLKILIQQLNGNIKTTAAFGKKWIRNMIANYLSIDCLCQYEFSKSPVVIASSGPTLKKSIKQLIKYRDKYLLWALPSSLMALDHFGLKADLIITTDPGFYGTFHMNHLQSGIPVALPLTASRGLWNKENPAIILNQQFPFENDLFSLTSMNNRIVPSNGTVSGTALELAQGRDNNIYYAGLDLCYKDIQSHIRPHSFDTLLESESMRLDPSINIYYNRASYSHADFDNKIRRSQSLDTYANWFNSKPNTCNDKIKRLNPSPVEISNMEEGFLSELKNRPHVKKQKSVILKSQKPEERNIIVQKLLSIWLQGLESGSRDDLEYFIDTESYTRKERSNKSLDFISELRGLYG